MRISSVYKILSVVVLAVLTLVALFMPVKSIGNGWIPIMSGLETWEILQNGAVSILLGIGMIGTVLFSLYFLLRRTSSINFQAVVVVFLLLVSATPAFLHFSTIQILLLLLVWMHYCVVEKQIFTAFMLLSLASLFYAPSIWLIPLSLSFIPFSGTPDSLKSFVKALAGFLLPHIYMLVFRWISFDDAGVYFLGYWDSITDFHFMERKLLLPGLFLSGYLIYIISRASIFAVRSSTSKLVQGILKMQILSLALSLPFFICFDRDGSSLFPIIAYPAAVLIAFYFNNSSNIKRSSAELVLLLLAIIINCVSHYI